MDAYQHWADRPASSRAIEFSGTMKEFLPIAISNFLLTIVTLSIYRSWAKARERRYLWSRTRFIDDELHWSGSGAEMFVGFIFVALMLAAIGLAFFIGLPAVASRVGVGAALALLAVFYVGALFLFGLARFRALRYRLSRTWWHGIRGGSNDGGGRYAVKAVGYYLAAFLLFGFLYPWAQAKLWNERWNRMSFGPYLFTANVTNEDTKGPFVLLWLAVVVGGGILSFIGGTGADGQPGDPGIIATLCFYAVAGLAYINFNAHFYRAASEWTRFGDIEFRLEAETSDWIGFYARTIGLAIITLGLAMIVYQFRKWQFVTTHLEAFGTVQLDELTQSETAAPKEAEGLLDALDIGAF